MDTSVTIIGVVISALIGIPLYKVFRASALNKNKIKEILSRFPQYQFGLTETQNKRVLALDPKNKGFLHIDFNHRPEVVSFVNLNEVTSCQLVPTTEGNSQDIIKIELEFLYRDSTKQMVTCYAAEHDQMTQVCLYEDHELAKRWQKQIASSLPA